jgi:hypothetical protein
MIYREIMSLPLREEQLIACTSCLEDLQHCHGTAIVNVDGAHVCSDEPQCTLAIDEHWYVALDED